MTHLLELPEHVQRLTKPFTIENLRMDAACKPGMEFVIPIIESGGDVATALKEHSGTWVQWAITQGYDVRHLWGEGYTWNERGHMFLTSSTLSVSALRGGSYSTLTAVGTSVMQAGYKSTLTGGDGSVMDAGHCSTLTTGEHSQLRSFDGSKYRAGANSYIINDGFDGMTPRRDCAFVGEGGLKPNTFYTFQDGAWVEVP